MLSTASSLDNLICLDIWEFVRSETVVSALSAYLSRANRLESLLIVFVDGEADIRRVTDAIIKNQSIRKLSFFYQAIRKPDITPLFDLLAQTHSINDLEIGVKDLDLESLYLGIDYFAYNKSVIRLKLNSTALRFAAAIDYERITASMSKNQVVSEVNMHVFKYGYGYVDFKVDAESVQRVFESCCNLDKLTIKESVNSRSNERELQNLMRISRTFVGSQMTKDSRLPRELLNIILYEGFKHLNWFDGQLNVVVRALVDRRTLGIVRKDLLPLSRPYLYVCCQDALEKIRELH